MDAAYNSASAITEMGLRCRAMRNIRRSSFFLPSFSLPSACITRLLIFICSRLLNVLIANKNTKTVACIIRCILCLFMDDISMSTNIQHNLDDGIHLQRIQHINEQKQMIVEIAVVANFSAKLMDNMNTTVVYSSTHRLKVYRIVQ